jgi:protein SCO1/2
MKPIQKVLMTILWGLTVLIMVSVIGAGLWKKRADEFNHPLEPAAATSQPTIIGPAPAFELVDQDNKPVSKESLAGKVWIADFVFTHCAGPCPRMTSQMAGLSKEIPASVQLITFSVDPDRDTPAVLKEYAKRFEADESRWRFLTGPEKTIFAAAHGMMLSAEPKNDKGAILHSTRFVLIDAEGNIRNTYESGDEARMAALKKDASDLASGAAEKH